MYLTTKYNMSTPPSNDTNSLQVWLSFLETLFPFATVFGFLWKGVHELFKYLSEKRKAELKEMIKDEVAPQIEMLTKSIDKLSDSVNELKHRT